MPKYLLAIDQGTTSTRAIIYNESAENLGHSAQEFPQYYPKPGWVEHDAEEIWATVAAVIPKAIQSAKIDARDIVAIGLTNQRETVVAWDKSNGRPAHRAIVWQDRRTTDFCRQRQGDEPWLNERTGLVVDPYFSATKIRWLLDQDANLQAQAEAGKLACGTVDSWLIWRLTRGRHFQTDVSNSSRTLLLNLKTGQWDDELCGYFKIPQSCLAEVLPSAAEYGSTNGLDFLPDGIPILGVAGDQQAALFGQCGFEAGEAKCTYGTGAFFLQHIGDQPALSKNRLLTSIAATVDERLEYVLEGSVFVAGAAVQWLRDGLKLFDEAPQIEAMAEHSDPEQPVLFVPGLVGLGAPHWAPEARGTIFGLTRATTGDDLGRAALEGVAFQIADLVEAADKDTSAPTTVLRADGGMAQNNWFVQCQADVLGIPVLQSLNAEATALGAAWLAGLKAGIWPDREHLRGLAAQNKRFEPSLDEKIRQQRLSKWRHAVRSVIEFYESANNS